MFESTVRGTFHLLGGGGPLSFLNGSYAVQIVGDQNFANTIYVLDNNGQIWGSLDTSDPWINLTGKQGLINNPTSLQIYDPPASPGASVLLVGALGGVYQTTVNLNNVTTTTPAPLWSLYGEGLPNVQVSSLEYVAADDLLLAGTYGRGAWEITSASAWFGSTAVTTISASNGTIVLRQDPTQPNNAQLLIDGPGATVSQVLQDNNVQEDVPWSILGQITIDSNAETVDILNVPQGVDVIVQAGSGSNTVNFGSAANQVSTINGIVNVAGSLGAPTYINVNDQGDTAAGAWTVGGGSITGGSNFPGTIDFADVEGVVINGGAKTNRFTVNDTGKANLTLNTGGGGNGNTVTVNNTSYAATLDINNQVANSTTNILGTAPDSTTKINDSNSDAINLGNNTTLTSGGGGRHSGQR